MVYVFSQDQGVACEKPSQSTTTNFEVFKHVWTCMYHNLLYQEFI